MATVVSNTAKATMIAAISGTDLKAILLDPIVLTAGIPIDALKTIDNYNTSGVALPALSAFEVTGIGYVASGVSLSGVSAYAPGIGNSTAYFDGNSVVWPLSTITAGGMAVYKASTGLVVYLTVFPDLQQSFYGNFSVAWTDNHLMQMIG
jgi:hypothetical protein